MDINYKPQVDGWLENKCKVKRENTFIGFAFILFLFIWIAFSMLFLSKAALNISSTIGFVTIAGLLAGFSAIVTILVFGPDKYTINFTNTPELKVEFLQTRSMKYWIVLGNKQEELKINGKTVDLLTENEVHNVKQELYRRWLACENEALQKAYEKGYKSKSKLL